MIENITNVHDNVMLSTMSMSDGMELMVERFTNYNVRECVETRVAIRHRPDFAASVDVGIGPAINPNRR